MLNFRQFILLEDRLDYLKSIHKNIDTSHDSLAKHHEPNDIINHFAQNADPTVNKQYTQWILKQYKNKSIRQEDHPRINDALSNFDRYKSKLPRKDLNQYRSLNDLEDSLQPHIGVVASNKEQSKLDKSGAEKIHDENGITVHHLKTKEAACHYGKGTKWCTAANSNNMFHDYNKYGPIYLIHGRDGNGEIKKYQFHFPSNQFMNDKDEPINLGEFIRNNPEIKNVKEFQGSHHFFPLTPEGKQYHINKLNTGEATPNDIKRAVDNNYLTPDHIDNIIKNPNNTSSHYYLVKHRGDTLTPEQIDTIIKNPNSTDAHGRLVFDAHKLSPEQIDTIIKNPNTHADIKENLVANHNGNIIRLSPKQIDNIIKSPNSYKAHETLLRDSIFSYSNNVHELTPDQIDTIIKNPNSYRAHEFIRLVFDAHQLSPEQKNILNSHKN